MKGGYQKHELLDALASLNVAQEEAYLTRGSLLAALAARDDRAQHVVGTCARTQQPLERRRNDRNWNCPWCGLPLPTDEQAYLDVCSEVFRRSTKHGLATERVVLLWARCRELGVL
jgi:hypothetical protein